MVERGTRGMPPTPLPLPLHSSNFVSRKRKEEREIIKENAIEIPRLPPSQPNPNSLLPFLIVSHSFYLLLIPHYIFFLCFSFFRHQSLLPPATLSHLGLNTTLFFSQMTPRLHPQCSKLQFTSLCLWRECPCLPKGVIGS